MTYLSLIFVIQQHIADDEEKELSALSTDRSGLSYFHLLFRQRPSPWLRPRLVHYAQQDISTVDGLLPSSDDTAFVGFRKPDDLTFYCSSPSCCWPFGLGLAFSLQQALHLLFDGYEGATSASRSLGVFLSPFTLSLPTSMHNIEIEGETPPIKVLNTRLGKVLYNLEWVFHSDTADFWTIHPN
ncbi:hypothetical protein CPB84DRAFT_1751651 [Gymnopilus junonius]|uniref:Uncharacterized protein n=1 Tax=Gymnopilus junonius TaxID=109634 RepID=A0A9P5NCI6_GYMJU|nr:hypothetical protein CPB84DRAFT_1751651 [Gymnopilus junonius]